MKSNILDIILLGTLTVVLILLYLWSVKWFHTVIGLSILYVAVHGAYVGIIEFRRNVRHNRMMKRGLRKDK